MSGRRHWDVRHDCSPHIKAKSAKFSILVLLSWQMLYREMENYLLAIRVAGATYKLLWRILINRLFWPSDWLCLLPVGLKWLLSPKHDSEWPRELNHLLGQPLECHLSLRPPGCHQSEVFIVTPVVLRHSSLTRSHSTYVDLSPWVLHFSGTLSERTRTLPCLYFIHPKTHRPRN